MSTQTIAATIALAASFMLVSALAHSSGSGAGGADATLSLFLK